MTLRRCSSWCLAAVLCLSGIPALHALNPDRRPDSYSLQGWFTEHGLPSNKIRAVVQTRDGYLWLATAQGLTRFDGSRFTVFNGASHPELRGGGFFALQEMPDGSLWAGGDNGLFRWRNDRFERFTTEHGLAHNYVRALALTREGDLAISTRKGYSFLRDGRIVSPGGEWRSITGVARAYLQLPDGTAYLGTDDGLWRARGDRVEKISGGKDFSGTAFVALLAEPDGSVLVGYDSGLQRLHPDGRRQNYAITDGFNAGRVAVLARDRDQNIWVAASRGLYRFSRGRFEPALKAEKNVSLLTQQMVEDREGGLWLGTSTGLFRLKDNIGAAVDQADGLSHPSVFSTFEARDGTWWIGTWGGGVYRFDQKQATRLEVPEALRLMQILSFAEAHDGTIWIGANNGLFRYQNGKVDPYYDSATAQTRLAAQAADVEARLPSLAHPRVNAIAVEPDGRLWVACDGALYDGLPGEFRLRTQIGDLSSNIFKSVVRARHGDVWVAAPPAGVARLRGGQWTTFHCGREISDVYPRSIYEDRYGVIWVTTEGGGLNRFKNDQWRVFTTADGLADDFISGIIEDDFEDFWVFYPRGLMRIAREDFDRVEQSGGRLEPQLFNRFDGLPAGEANQQGAPNAFRTRDGRLLFPTDHGVAIVDPRLTKLNELTPPVYVERVVINGTAVDLSRPVVVPPGTNQVQIFFTAPSLLAPEKVQFKIRLSPLDAQWTDTGGRRDIRYTTLPPGSYTFSVIASNNDGFWNERGAVLAFTVRPFFYQTGWFISSVVVLLAAAIGAAFWIRARLARARLAALETIVAKRTAELQLAKDSAESAVREKNTVIEQLRVAQEEIVVERTRFQFIFQAVPVGISWSMLGAESSRLVNPAHAAITGLPPCGGLSDDDYWRATHLDDRASETVAHERLMRGEIDRYELEKRFLHADGTTRWALLAMRVHRDPTTGERQEITTLVDITERKQAENRLADTHSQLVIASRQAGMAEVAIGVLHNVGNVLNSVNVSTTLVADIVRRSKVERIGKLAELLASQRHDLAAFLQQDPRGQKIPDYLQVLSEHLRTEQAEIGRELEGLRKNVEHINDIVAMQQNYARQSGVAETIPIVELVEDALRMNAGAFTRHHVAVVRDYRAQLSVTVDKHKVLQILVNLMRNAKYACDESGRSDGQMQVSIAADDQRVRIDVRDNGVGIPPENLTRIFSHGFTTRKHGHGFGLHSCALAARDLGGSLNAHSEGPGQGATFTLELPSQSDARAA